MMMFFKSTNKNDNVNNLTVLSKDDVGCYRSAYRYFEHRHLKGMPVVI